MKLNHFILRYLVAFSFFVGSMNFPMLTLMFFIIIFWKIFVHSICHDVTIEMLFQEISLDDDDDGLFSVKVGDKLASTGTSAVVAEELSAAALPPMGAPLPPASKL